MKSFLILCTLTVFMAIPLSSFRAIDFDQGNSNIQEKVKADVTDYIFVKASYYNPTFAQCDSTPLITASGAEIDTINTTALHWCAISYNLHKRYGGFLEFGDVVYLEGFQGKKKIKGRYIVNDLMNPKWTDKVDILKGSGENSVTFDSVKLKHPKIKTFKKNMSDKAEYTAKSLKRQGLYHSINKMLSKIPFIGSQADVLKNENFKERICSIDQLPRNNVSLMRAIIRRNA